MSLRLLIDMNLSPDWVVFLGAAGFESIHWSSIGDPRAKDTILMEWERTNGHVVSTHDLDFGTLLALTHATGPSVLQVRTQDILPDEIGDLVLSALRTHAAELEAGALLVIDESKLRVRILPLRRR